ncbi:MAG: fasciclin domain-containing protein [Porphyromonadaceae bacterium]|nr:fasciclin domain-containing protein [Porphyromonadaceae bacterium]
MKKLFLLLLAVCGWTACNDTWDDYYDEGASVSNVDTTMTRLDCSIIEFFQTHDEYSAFYNLLDKVGGVSSLEEDQELTVWAVNNAIIDSVSATYTEGTLDTDTSRIKYHVNYLGYNKSQMKDGLRLKTLTGIYIAVTVDEAGDIYANTSKVIDTYLLNNGVVYIIDDLMSARLNLYEYIKQLGNDYSMYRDSILAYSVEQFDASKSTPIGVDKTGNTIYDSVFVVYNPLFDTTEINSEFKQFTCFIPNNDVMQACLATMNETYIGIGKAEQEDPPSPEYPYLGLSDVQLAYNWIKRATIFEGTLSAEEASEDDIYSAFDKQWKNTDQDGNPVQVIDTENPVELSNGRVYWVENLKVPINVLITRFKQFLYHYEYVDADSLPYFFSIRGYTSVKCNEDATIPDLALAMIGDTAAVNAGATPDWDCDPFKEFTYTWMSNYRYLRIQNSNSDLDGEFSVAFTPVTPYEPYTIKRYSIPAGEYTLYLGFRSSGACTGNVYFATAELDEDGNLQIDPDDDYADNPDVLLKSPYTLVGSNLNFSLATPWNFDRNGGDEMEEYSSGKNVWNANGGKVGTVVVEGEGMQSVRIKIKWTAGDFNLYPYHWTLKPTENNY